MPKFTGDVNEDPVEFLTEIENSLSQEDLRKWDIIIKPLLEGIAKQWAEQYTRSMFNWDSFKVKFLDHFNSKKKIREAWRELYMTKQKNGETGEAFVRNKMELANRVGTYDIEDIIDLINRQYRLALYDKPANHRLSVQR